MAAQSIIYGLTVQHRKNSKNLEVVTDLDYAGNLAASETR